MKKIDLPIGKEKISIRVPVSADVLLLKKAEPLVNCRDNIYKSLNNPIGTQPLSALSQKRKNACIVVSDNTRPVPYKGKNGILRPIIDTLKRSSIHNITIIIANGTHRSMTDTEIKNMLDKSAFQDGIKIINHVASEPSMLRNIGRTKRTPEVTVNRHYLDSDLKILTGLVEPHFMAGFSGGRKTICPGICGQSVTYGFHSASILSNPDSTSLNLDNNPCHDEAVKIAQMAGTDFILNVTINSDKKMTGVFSGDMEKAHSAAIGFLKKYASINLNKEYDIVITQAGDVGINHYQCAKAAIEASRAVKQNGKILLAGNLMDLDPLGSKNYKQILQILAASDHEIFTDQILSPHWNFVPEQWQVQMWANVFKKLGNSKNFFICTPQLQNLKEETIPETNIASCTKRKPQETDIDFLERITQDSIDKLILNQPESEILILPDGPYAVPVQNKI